MGANARPMGITKKQVHFLLRELIDFVSFPKVYLRSRCLVFTDRTSMRTTGLHHCI